MIEPTPPGGQPLVADGPPPGKRLGRVLILEDDEELAELFRDWIRRFYGDDATVRVTTTVADAETALESLSALDAAIIDRMLPDGDGRELLSTIRSRFDAIAVMITGASPDSDLVELAVDDYLLKPVEEETFIKRLSLLTKLHTADALEPYSEARKASLLEYHLEEPEDDPVFRRFANRWSYDKLEIAHVADQRLVYALYIGGEGEVSVSIVGALDPDVESLVADEEIAPIGELVPTEDGYAWIGAVGRGSVDADPDSITVYEFTGETPEQYVSGAEPDAGDIPNSELREILETKYN